METILYNISQVLGITIIHSLWQGLFVYFLLRLVLMLATQLSASKKYLLAVTSLLAMTSWFFYTLVNEVNIYHWLAVKPDKLSAVPLMAELPAAIGRFNDQTIRYYYSIEKYLPYITIIYVAGLLFNTARLILARKKIKAITHSMSIDIQLQELVNTFTGVLDIGAKVRVGLSGMIDVPCMVGYFKPVILLPFTLSTYLSAEEIEAILLHELAHIKRNDYLVNILQQVLSILLFFNPCALLINRIINEERENCCDDLVVKGTADPMNYAKALLKLEQTRQNDWKLALAATGKKYHLLNRIQRIMKTQKPTTSVRPALLAMLILTAGISAIALLKPEIAQGKISVKAIAPVIKNLIYDTTTKTLKAHKIAAVKKSEKLKSKTNIIVSPYGISNDEKLEKLTAEVDRYSRAVNNYYNSPEFKQQVEAIEQKNKAIEDYYNNPEVRKLHDEQESLGQYIEAQSAEMKEMSRQMEANSQKMSAYFNSKAFQQLVTRLETKYNIPHNRYYSNRDTSQWDEKYKKFQSEISENMPSYVKSYREQLAQNNRKMRALYDSPEYHKRISRMQALSDSVSANFNNTNVRQQLMEVARLSQKMQAYQNNASIKQQQKLLRDVSKRLEEYTNSPEFKARMRKMKSFSNNYNFNFDDNADSPERPERLERPEKPEKQEQKEKDEAPEN